MNPADQQISDHLSGDPGQGGGRTRTWEVTDPKTNKSYEITGDSPPTEQELITIFDSPTRPDIRTIAQDPEFQKLPIEEQRKAFAEYDPDFAKLPTAEQDKGIRELIQGSGLKRSSIPEGNNFVKAGSMLKNMITNAPESAWETAKNMVQPVIHPIDTVKAIGSLIVGGAEKLIPGQQDDEKHFDAAAQFFADRYGGLENLQRTIEKDPVGFLTDVASVISGGGAVLKATGKAGEIASAMSKAGEAVNPINMAAKGTAKVGELVAKGTGRLTSETLGVTTGAGRGAIQEAVKGGEAFRKAMRGEITGEEVVEHAKGALQTIRDSRAEAYQQQLQVISQNQQSINLAPIRNKLDQLMARYNVKADPSYKMKPTGVLDANGNPIMQQVKTGEKIDASRVAMGDAGRKDIEAVIERVKKWGSESGDDTALGLDVLKRQLDDFYSESSQARGFVAELRDQVARTIKNAVPEYSEMTKGYRYATTLIKDIESSLMLRKEGMSGRITADSTLRRLTSALKENFEMRKELLASLGEEGGSDVMGEVAGYAMKDLVPKGLVAKLGVGAAGITLNPKMWPLLAAASPRAVGEFLTVVGRAKKWVANPANAAKMVAGKYAGPLTATSFQAGRLARQRTEEQAE
jgi:hypothetical protein